MSLSKPTITVIIPTLAVREGSLERAISSVVDQERVEAVPLVIVNGDRFVPSIVEKLHRDPRIRFYQMTEVGVSRARYTGRGLVQSEFFSFLDDDDELLPDGLALSAQHLVDDESLDVVVTDGYWSDGVTITDSASSFPQHTADLCLDLIRSNWLSSPGGLYRTERVPDRFFADLPDFYEFTVLAMKIAQSLKVKRVDAKTFMIHKGHHDQASKSRDYTDKEADVLSMIEGFVERHDVKKMLRKKRSNALHRASMKALRESDIVLAWKYHLASLLVGGGLRYLPSTRHFLRWR